MLEIQDPRQHATIDVTGWDLDHLAELVTVMRGDLLVGSERELTDEELIALTSDDIDMLLNTVPSARGYALWGYALGDGAVSIALDRLGEIVDEALYQRDLPRALAKLDGTVKGELTMGERRAYGEYVDGMTFEDFTLEVHGTVV